MNTAIKGPFEQHLNRKWTGNERRMNRNRSLTKPWLNLKKVDTMTELESYKSQAFDLFTEKVYSNAKEVIEQY